MEESVRRSSTDAQNESIDESLQLHINLYANKSPEAINRRLEELDREWDIERMLEMNMPVVALTGLVLGSFVDKKWLGLSALALGFFMQHAIQGWCPPLYLFRQMGYRTRKEIERERYALKILKGDFDGLNSEQARFNTSGLVHAL